MNTILVVLALGSLLQTKEAGPQRWEATIAKFEAQDQEERPEPGGVLFVGSSSIRMWDLQESFPGKKYLNRGFGGSQIEDVNYYVDRIVLPYKPSKIVFYAGDNDVAKDKSPETVLRDFQHFVSRVHEKQPETQVLFIAIKPSVKRWELWPTMKKANELIADFAKSTQGVEYVDIARPMLGDEGKPSPDLFIKDGLHLSPKGYEVWKAALVPFGI